MPDETKQTTETEHHEESAFVAELRRAEGIALSAAKFYMLEAARLDAELRRRGARS